MRCSGPRIRLHRLIITGCPILDVSEMYIVDSERRVAFSLGDGRGHGLHLTCRVRKAPHSVQCSQTPSKPGRELCWRDATEHGSGERRRGHVGAQGAHSPRAPHRAPSKLPGVGPCCNLSLLRACGRRCFCSSRPTRHQRREAIRLSCRWRRRTQRIRSISTMPWPAR